MKGYKASTNGKCRDITYEVGKTYTFNGELKACATGFHYCKKIDDVLSYYNYDRNTTVIFEIDDLGDSIDEGNKTVTNKMKIVRIVDPSEYNTLFTQYQFDSNNNLIKVEDSNGYWHKREYDSNNNQIKVEDSNGYWHKREYDSNNNQIKFEDSTGYWHKREYDSNNNQIKCENSTGYWKKCEYDSNNNQIKYENSYGDWTKCEYDSNNNVIAKETKNKKWTITIE